ncbi:hypothetical protein [Leptolyngbya iicbica]|uniref:Uncharacterized protein n=2 Tax=Cyanophyceae TaxID=3028117 RepID=A0A4Q7E527_9CYAN|nr:hypothetical protein [Leptolyngbya sp. LK]RZM77174.1 hypothetical protein DYY88_16120 [Leptolyngbya sp. LK]
MSTAWLTTGATLPTATPIPARSLHLADITIQVPVVIPGYPVIVVPRREVEPSVTVRFVAEGDDWASIYLDGRLLFRANNTRRDHIVQLDPGAYYLEVTGVTSFDRWAAGYLDVGRNDANVVVIRYGKDSGVRVAGDPYVWLPDEVDD